MAYFIPSSIQKRLLRYALSRLELLDTDALDLESLDIAWSKRSTVELKNVGFRINKLRSLLQLPDHVELDSANIARLSVTVPADIYSSSIIVEAEGVRVHISLPIQRQTAPNQQIVTEAAPGSRAARRDSLEFERTQSFIPSRLDSTGLGSNQEKKDYIPTARDLATSFLLDEPKEERRELEAAISSRSQYLHQSTYSTASSDEEANAGLGTGLGLPGFLANFLKGIVDRLEVRITDVSFNVVVSMQQERALGQDSISIAPTIALRLDVSSINVHSVGDEVGGISNEVYDAAKTTDSQATDAKLRIAKRRISLKDIHGYLICDPTSLSPGLAQVGRYSKRKESPVDSPILRRPYSTQSRTLPESQDRKYGQNLTSQISLDRHNDMRASSDTLQRSTLHSEDGKFSDATEEDLQASHTESINNLDLSLGFVDNSAMAHSLPGSQNLEHSVDFPPNMRQSLQEFRAEKRRSNSGGYSGPRSFSTTNVGPVNASESLKFGNSRTVDGDQTPTLPKSAGGIAGNDHITPVLNDLNVADDLLQSREFTHEEARSLYMSAMAEQDNESLQSSQSIQNPDYHHVDSQILWPDQPETMLSLESRNSQFGHDLTEVKDSEPEAVLSSEIVKLESQDSQILSHPMDDRSSPDPSDIDANTVTSHVVSPSKDSPVVSEVASLMTTRILFVDTIDIWLPDTDREEKEEELNQLPTQPKSPRRDVKKHSTEQSQYFPMPGAFSEYAERSQFETRRQSFHDASILQPAKPPKLKLDEERNGLELLIGSFQIQIDILNSQILTRLVQQLLDNTEDPPPSDSSKPVEENDTQSGHDVCIKLAVKEMSISFFESLQTRSSISSRYLSESSRVWTSMGTGSEGALFKMIASDAHIKHIAEVSSILTKLEIGRLTIGFSDRHIVSFSKDAGMRKSVRDLHELQPGRDISIQVNKFANLLDVNISTLPVKVDLDILKLDETLSCFGGFSGLLELGNSITSNGPTMTEHKPNTAKARSVRFESASEPAGIDSVAAKFKMQSRIGGAHITLHGKDCHMNYQSTAIKVVGRDGLFGARIDHAQIKGPFFDETKSQPPVDLQLHDVLLKFLLFPEEQDLTKLLSLITPSKDKFEEDDDILIETLLQQRKKGSVLRASITKAELKILDPDSIEALQNLMVELSKLSSVAKYLPEDDRPGVMVLGSVGQFKILLEAPENIGKLSMDIKKAEIGHVGLPPLLALSINSIATYRNDNQAILHQVLEHHKADCPPMVMARIIGDEMEPTVKIKLYNICAEYSVPLAMAILNLSPDSRTEEKVVHLANSIAHLTYSISASETSTENATHHNDFKPNSKPLVLDIALRDCAIGLTPQKISAKGIFVLTDVHFSGALPTDIEIDIMLNIRKSSFLIVNNIEDITADIVRPSLSKPGKSALGSVQILELCRQGYVSIAIISAAKLYFKQIKSSVNGPAPIEMDLRDALLVLESCADSTETLLKIFEGLSLPSPPSTGQDYRQEIGPIEDLMASVLLDAFGADQGIDHPILDHEDHPDMLKEDEDYDDEELAADSEVLNAFARDRSAQFLDPLMDSMLFTRSHEQTSRIPAESISYRTKVGTDVSESFEILRPDLAYDNFKIRPMASLYSGSAHKWNSAQNKYVPIEISEIGECPLKVRVRGLHVIWNLFDGYDWEKTRDTIAEAVKDIEAKAAERRANRRRSLLDEHDEESVIGDFLFNSIYIGIPANRDDHDLRRRINANVDDLESETGSYASTATARVANTLQPKRQKLKLNRSKRHKITFELRGINADFYMFKPGGETQSSIDVGVDDVEVFDHVPTSTWKKFATYMHDAGVREDGKPMLHLEICNVRPAPELNATELVIKVSVLPLRLHVDQDALDFITRFFEFSDKQAATTPSPDSETYLQRVEVEAVQLKLDYKPKKVDYAGLRSGHTTEFMNFFILDGADILLKHAIIYGVRGFTRLHKDLDGVWMPDIKRNQLPAILSGLTGVRSLVDVGLGIRDMIEIPIQEYRKDGRIMKSIQKGAAAFGKTTSELTRLGAKLATSAQTTLQGAEELFVRPDPYNDAGWEVTDLDDGERRATSNYADQPAGIMQGLKGAADGLRREALLTRDTIVAMSSGIRESTSATGAAGAIAKHAPTIIFRPVIGASRAVSQTLMGATNSLDPESRRRFEDKYKKY